MVKRTITITTILLIISMIIGVIIVLNRASFATSDVIITFDANGGMFDDNSTRNILTHSVSDENVIYVHSPNWSDDGRLLSGFISNSYGGIAQPEAYTIEGASNLHVNVVYGSYSNRENACYVAPGDVTNLNFYNVQNNLNLLPEGSVKLKAEGDGMLVVADITIPGDTVTISATDIHGSYGHFITISGDTLQSGEYKDPIPSTSSKKFVSWNTQPDGHGVSYYGYALPRTSKTLYAQYQDVDVIDSGVFRNVNWRIDKNYGLIMGLDGEEQTFSEETEPIKNSNYYIWDAYFTILKSVSFEGTVHGAQNMSNLFGGWYKNVETVDVHGFDTSNVTNMDWLFSGMGNNYTWEESGPYLRFLHLDEMDVSHVTTMKRMLEEVGAISIDLSEWDVSSVECFSDMFLDCGRAKVIDVRGWDTSSATNMYRMFGACINIEEIKGYEDFDTSNVTDLGAFFMSDSHLTSIDVTKWDTSKNEDFSSMFEELELLTELDVSNFDVSSGRFFEYMFSGCKQLTYIPTSNWHTGNIRALGFMLYDCTSLEEFDMSGFNCTDAVTVTTSPWSVENIFDNCENLKKVHLPASFKFFYNNYSSNHSILPTPSNEYPYKGKWVREDREYGPMSEQELQQQYNSEMAGVWVWDSDIIKYNVKYSYTGVVPENASNLPATRSYEEGENIIVAPNASAPGYTFSGWSRTGSFEMPGENVEITGSFTARTDTPYKVEHYLEDLKADTYTLKKTDNLTGTTDTEVTAEEREYEGFTFDSSINETKLSGNIAGDGSLVLKLYYKRNSYNVTYSYTGDIPGDASSLPQQETYEYGEEINVPEEATADGYTFSGWIKDYITMPAQDIEITGYFIENPKSYRYKVEYFFDGELDDTLDEILNAEKDEEISITPQTPLRHGEKNYTLVSDNHKITITVNDEDNVIKVYYETDVLDYAIDNFEDESTGDGISDKYQIRITYRVENGSWNDGTKNNKVNVITLYDKEGNPSETGIGNTKIPEVGSKPYDGYTVGSWNKIVPSKVSSKDNGDEYIYSYEKISKADIVELGGKGSNPKTGDVFHKYLIYGVLGMIVLMTAIKIRRKYSRKARKIQF